MTSFGSGFSNPHGIVVDPAGNLYVADYGSGHVYQETLQADGSYAQSVLFAGTGSGSAIGLARDNAGNFYIAGGGVLTKQTALSAGGYAASTIGSFIHPVGVAVDPAGNVFVVDDNASSLYELAAGSYAQSTLDADTLPTPFAVSIDNLGNLYVGTVRGSYIEKYTLTNGTYAKSNFLNAPSTYGVIADDLGDLFYASPDQFLKGTPNSGSYSEQVYYDYRVQALTQGKDRQLYAVSYFEGTGIRLNTAPTFGSVPVGTAASQPLVISFTVDTAGAFGNPTVVTQGAGGLDFSLAATTCSGTLAAGTSCTVTVNFKPTLPGVRLGGVNLVDGSGNVLATAHVSGLGVAPQGVIYPGTQSRLTTLASSGPITSDAGGNLYAGTSTGSLLKISPASGGYTTSQIEANLGNPVAIAVDGLGDLFVADSAQQRVVEEVLQPATGAYAPTTAFTAAQNGLANLGALAVDGSGTVYLGNGNQLLKEVPYGTGYVQAAVSTTFTRISALAVEGAGNLFAADSGTGTIYEETPGANGTYTERAVVSGLGNIDGLTLDAAGTLYVTTSGVDGIQRFAANAAGSYKPLGTLAGFVAPAGIALDGTGNLYVSAASNTSSGGPGLFRLDVVDPQNLAFPVTTVGGTSAAQTVTLTNIGNASLALTGVATSSANFTLDSATTTCPAMGSLTLAASCIAGVTFTPQLAGPLHGTLNLTDNTLNQPGSVQMVTLNAAGMGPVTVAVSNVSVVYGTASSTLTATVTYAGTVPPSGGLSFTVDNGKAVQASCSATAPTLTCTASYPTATLAVGSHTITASEAADTYYAAAAGTGTLTVTAAVVPDFSFTNSGASTATVSAGAGTSFNFQLSPLAGGYPGEVSFAVTGLPAQASYKLSPASASAASGSQIVQLSVQTTAPSAAKASNTQPAPPWAGGAAVLSAALFPLALFRGRRRALATRLLGLLVLLVGLTAAAGLTGCGLVGYAYQAPESFVVTVTATSGGVQHAATVNLTVQ